jgi:hypothetical protein
LRQAVPPTEHPLTALPHSATRSHACSQQQQQASSSSKQQQQQQQAPSKVEAAYLLSTRKRIMASKPAVQRRVAVLDDDQEMARLAGGTKDAPLYVRNRQVCACWGACWARQCCHERRTMRRPIPACSESD